MKSLNELCEKTGYTVEQIIGRGGSQTLKTMRKIAMYKLNHIDGMSQNDIAKLFNRHHSVISTGIRDVKKAQNALA